jgi:hypothetical protein
MSQAPFEQRYSDPNIVVAPRPASGIVQWLSFAATVIALVVAGVSGYAGLQVRIDRVERDVEKLSSNKLDVARWQDADRRLQRIEENVQTILERTAGTAPRGKK